MLLLSQSAHERQERPISSWHRRSRRPPTWSATCSAMLDGAGSYFLDGVWDSLPRTRRNIPIMISHGAKAGVHCVDAFCEDCNIETFTRKSARPQRAKRIYC